MRGRSNSEVIKSRYSIAPPSKDTLQKKLKGMVIKRSDQKKTRHFRYALQHLSRIHFTYTIERCFVEVRRRTRPMVCFVNVPSVTDIFGILQMFCWGVFTQAMTK